MLKKCNLLFLLLLLAVSVPATAVPLTSWNLNLGTVGGSNATDISTVNLNGFSELAQAISANTGFGESFSLTGSLAWIQYTSTSNVGPSTFGLPAGYTDLFFHYEGLTGVLDASGNANFNSGVGTITLYLDSGSSLVPSGNALALATYSLGNGSSASDIAYYDGGGASAMLSFHFQLLSEQTGLFTDNNGDALLIGDDFTVDVDGLLDPGIFPNPTVVASGDGTSVNTLLNAGAVSTVNVSSPSTSIPEPGSAMLLLLGLLGLVVTRSNRRISS